MMKRYLTFATAFAIAVIIGFLTPQKVSGQVASLLFGSNSGAPQVLKSTNNALWVSVTGGSMTTGSITATDTSGVLLKAYMPNVAGATYTPILAGAGAGNVNNGVHSYKFTITTAQGETAASTATPNVTVVDKTVNGKVTVRIPLFNTSTQVTNLKIYRTAAGGSTYLLLATLSDLSNFTYLDNIADASLGAAIPSTNTTIGTRYTLNGDAIYSTYSDWQTGNFFAMGDPTTDNATGIVIHDTLTRTGDAGYFSIIGGGADTGHGSNIQITAGQSNSGTAGDLQLSAGGSNSGTAGTLALNGLDITGTASRNYDISGVTAIHLTAASVLRAQFIDSALQFKSDYLLSWVSSTIGSSVDVAVKRVSAAVLQVTDGSTGYGIFDTGEFTTTSTGNIDDLDFGNKAIIRMNNATLATIRGIKAGINGQRVVIVSVGAGEVDLSHQDTGDGTATSRLINFVTVGVTPLAPGSGAATYQYDVTTARWRLVAHTQGAAITPGFSAGDYTGSGSMTWTVESGDVSRNSYIIHGNMLSWQVFINTTTVGGTPSTYLQIAIPGSHTFVGLCSATGWGLDNNTRVSNILFSQTAGTLGSQILSGANWAAATNTSQVVWNVNCQIN